MTRLTTFFCRFVIVTGFMSGGLLLGMLWAAYSGAAEGSGLAGGAIVLGYGVIAAAAAALAGLLVGLRLTGATLRRVAVTCGAIILLIALLATLRMQQARLANLDPPEAYVGVPAFVLTLQRTDLADPVLAKRVTIDSNARTWEMQLPDGRSCASQATAESLRAAAAALQAFREASGGAVSCSGNTQVIVTWRIATDTARSTGSIRLDAACLASASEEQRLVFAVQQVTQASNAPVTCE